MSAAWSRSPRYLRHDFASFLSGTTSSQSVRFHLALDVGDDLMDQAAAPTQALGMGLERHRRDGVRASPWPINFRLTGWSR